MIVVSFEAIVVYLVLLSAAIVNTLWFDPAGLGAVEQYPESAWVIGGVVFLAGASTLLGESAILFVNRVRKGRFFLSLLFTNTIGGPVMKLRNRVFQLVSGSRLERTNEDILLRFAGRRLRNWGWSWRRKWWR